MLNPGKGIALQFHSVKINDIRVGLDWIWKADKIPEQNMMTP